MKRDHLKTVWAIVALFLLQTVLFGQEKSATKKDSSIRQMGNY